MKYGLLFILVLSLRLVVCAQPSDAVGNRQLNAWGLQDVLTDSLNQKTERLLAVWDSLYPKQKSIVFNLLSEQQWKDIFEAQYQYAIRSKNGPLKFKLALPLAILYHVLSEFSKELPLLQYLYQHKQNLSSQNLGLVLIKLEEVYRNRNNMNQAFLIRGERFERGFISTYWELYRECGLWQEALNDYRLFEKLPEEIGVPRMKYYFFFGDIFFKSKQYDSAEHYFKLGFNAAQLFMEKNKFTKEVSKENAAFWGGYFSGFIGNCHVARGDYSKAIPFLTYDLSLCKGRYRIYSLLSLSDCYLQQGRLSDCKNIIDTLRGYLEGKQMKDQKLYFSKILTGYHKAEKRFDSTAYYLQQYSEAKEEINDRIINNQAVVLLTKLEVQKRRHALLTSQSALNQIKLKGRVQQQQLLLLLLFLSAAIIIILLSYRHSRQTKRSKNAIEQQNVQLVESARKITLQNARNETLLGELHHRVKNNLQIIYSLLNLQRKRVNHADTKALLSGIQTRIQSISLVHETLCNSNTFESVDLDDYIRTLVAHLQAIYQQEGDCVAIKYDLMPVQLALDNTVSLGLIINEIVSNAFKYAFHSDKPGLLLFSIRTEGQNCLIEISDNGPGFSSDKIESSSLGIRLIKTMCAQLNAGYFIEHASGVKHTIKLTL